MPNKQGRKWIRDDKRLAIYIRDGFACLWCGRGVEHDAQLTLDHYVCREKQGTNEASNLVTACHDCNSRRQNRTNYEWAKCVEALHSRPHMETLDRIVFHLHQSIDRGTAKQMIADRGLSYAIAKQRKQHQPKTQPN